MHTCVQIVGGCCDHSCYVVFLYVAPHFVQFLFAVYFIPRPPFVNTAKWGMSQTLNVRKKKNNKI
jgi:hypothetical protein